MEKLDISSLKRNPNIIKKHFKKVGESIITDIETRIYFPERYEKKELAVLANTSRVTGVVAVVIGNEYAVMAIPTMVEFTPTEINQVEINNDVYYEFVIEKGMDVISNTKVIKTANKAYEFFELMIIQGKIPWYIDYMDLIAIFNNFKKYTGMGATENMLAVEILAAIISRVKGNLNKDYRLAIKKEEDLNKIPLEYVGLMDVYHSYKSTTNKLLGNYFTKAINSTILYPEKDISDLENVLRE